MNDNIQTPVMVMGGGDYWLRDADGACIAEGIVNREYAQAITDKLNTNNEGTKNMNAQLLIQRRPGDAWSAVTEGRYVRDPETAFDADIAHHKRMTPSALLVVADAGEGC